jgi:hypothetical protein
VAGHSWLRGLLAEASAAATLAKDFFRAGSPLLSIWAYTYEISGHRWTGKDTLVAPCQGRKGYTVTVTEYVKGKKGKTLRVETCVGYDPF